ncbi:MAG: aldo/keto reductase [Dehalococcoidales bacterium]
MDFKVLGRTGLRVSTIGLGCGGSSRVGQGTGKTDAESVAIVRQALDSGINIIDTAEGYRTEDIVGKAIKNIDRNSIVLSTKKTVFEDITPEQVQKGLEESLKRLGTDFVDIYYLHGVLPKDYDYLASEIGPLLQKMRDQGKIRFIGLTEMFNADTRHNMLQKALDDDIWDVMMVGFNMLNQSARDSVFANAIRKNIGIVIMFAVRAAFSRPEKLKQIISQLIENNQVNPSDIDLTNPLDFLIHDGGAVSLTDAAYRFCHYEPVPHVIFSGTGNPAHLEANIESFSRPPLPQEDLIKLKNIFRKVDSVTGQ